MINNVTLVGRLTKDVDLSYSKEGTAIGKFTIAVNRNFKKDETDFINIVCFKKAAENTANFTKKGSLVGVTGRIQVRTYEHDTKGRQYITEVVADNVTFLEPKNSTGSQKNQNEEQKDPFSDEKQIKIPDDLPF
jgi:single-strand DNA-binding protein